MNTSSLPRFSPHSLFPRVLTRVALITSLIVGLGAPSVFGQESPAKDAPREDSAKEAAKTEGAEGTKDAATDKEISPFFREVKVADPDLYVIRAGDKVEVKVFEEPDLTRDQVVDEAGRLDLELIGRVVVQGLTVKDAQALVAKKYDEDFLVDPLVRLTVLEKAKRRFVVLGQVRNPGFFEVPRSLKLDILQSLALAGGYTRLAGRVTHKRTTRTGEEVKRYSIKRLKKLPQSELPLIFEDDTIIVEESFF